MPRETSGPEPLSAVDDVLATVGSESFLDLKTLILTRGLLHDLAGHAGPTRPAVPTGDLPPPLNEQEITEGVSRPRAHRRDGSSSIGWPGETGMLAAVRMTASPSTGQCHSVSPRFSRCSRADRFVSPEVPSLASASPRQATSQHNTLRRAKHAQGASQRAAVLLPPQQAGWAASRLALFCCSPARGLGGGGVPAPEVARRFGTGAPGCQARIARSRHLKRLDLHQAA